MVLDDKGAAKPERLGLDVVFDEVAKSFAAVEFAGVGAGGPPRRRAAEQTELHDALLLAWPLAPRVGAAGAMFKIPVLYHGHSHAAWTAGLTQAAMRSGARSSLRAVGCGGSASAAAVFLSATTR